MNRNSRSYQPMVNEVLEDRAVPSRFGFGFGSRFGDFSNRLIGSVPAQDAQQVLRAFNTFQQTYSQDVRTILLAPGTTNPASNRPAFDRAVADALGTLNSSIQTTIANLPQAASLGTTIQGELLGSSPSSLQSLLGAIPTPGSTRFGSLRVFNRASSILTNQTGNLVSQQVRTSEPPSGSLSQDTVRQDLGQVQDAFRTFGQTYFNDVQTILLASGSTTPAGNRAACDQAVGTALTTLNTDINSALSNLPASLTASLNATIRDELLNSGSTTGNTLQARLAALPTPTSSLDFSARVFRINSSLTIGSAQGQVNRDILIAVNQYNTMNLGLTGS
jgi:hypothetical protein